MAIEQDGRDSHSYSNGTTPHHNGIEATADGHTWHRDASPLTDGVDDDVTTIESNVTNDTDPAPIAICGLGLRLPGGIRNDADLHNLTFINDDAWNVGRYGPFDVSFCCGLLYHLDRPREYLKLLGQVTRDMVIVNTHYAPASTAESRFMLSDLTTNEGLTGRWFFEHNLQPGAELENAKWLSWTNHLSFCNAKIYVA